MSQNKHMSLLDIQVLQNLPLFSSRTLSLSDGLKVKSSTKNSAGKTLVGGLFVLLLASSTYPDSNWTTFPPVLLTNPNGHILDYHHKHILK